MSFVRGNAVSATIAMPSSMLFTLLYKLNAALASCFPSITETEVFRLRYFSFADPECIMAARDLLAGLVVGFLAHVVLQASATAHRKCSGCYALDGFVRAPSQGLFAATARRERPPRHRGPPRASAWHAS
jgi:hypothetical protein